jgi:hypothetical protein
MDTFTRKGFAEKLELQINFETGHDLLVCVESGNIAFNGSHDLFEECVKRKIFVKRGSTIELSLFPKDRDPKYRAVTINAQQKIEVLMIRIMAEVNMTKDNYQKLADILAEVVE